MGSCMAINKLVTKCGLVDGLMYGYYLAGHEVSPGWWVHVWLWHGWSRSVSWLMGLCMAITWLFMKCPLLHGFIYRYDMAGHEVPPGWWVHVWVWHSWSRSVPWLMGSCMAITWLGRKCPLVDGLMYEYYMASHEVSPGWWAHVWLLHGLSRSVPCLMGSCMAITWLCTKCPLVDRFMYGYYMAGQEVSAGWWAHVWLLHGWLRSVSWWMGSCMAMTWLVTKCPLVDGFMYGYYMAGHEVFPGWWAHVWLLYG